jgi:GAF domain-containing protein
MAREADPLADRMQAAARELEHPLDPQATMEVAVRLAVDNVGTATAAGITLTSRKGHLRTEAHVGDMVEHADRLQYDLGEGPCREAIWVQPLVTSADLARDPRWPTWGPRVVAETERSVLSLRLFVQNDTVGSLNLYSRTAEGFDQDDVDVAVALATHTALAMAATREIESLNAALDTRTITGQAIGIVMERFRLSPDRALAVLVRLSSHNNLKLRDVATDLVTRGDLPQGPHS